VKTRTNIDALPFFWPLIAKCRMQDKVAKNGLPALKRKAANRAWILGALSGLGLAALLLILGVGKTTVVAPCMVAFGILALALRRASTLPRKGRQARVLHDVRPILQKPVIVVPEMKRAPRIVRAEPGLIIPALPPDRPRTRISERRPGPVPDDDA